MGKPFDDMQIESKADLSLYTTKRSRVKSRQLKASTQQCYPIHWILCGKNSSLRWCTDIMINGPAFECGLKEPLQWLGYLYQLHNMSSREYRSVNKAHDACMSIAESLYPHWPSKSTCFACEDVRFFANSSGCEQPNLSQISFHELDASNRHQDCRHRSSWAWSGDRVRCRATRCIIAFTQDNRYSS